MKKSILIAVVVFCGICAVVFAACCKKKCNDASNPECENYDPCHKKLTDANFTIYVKGVDDYYKYWKNNIDQVDTLYTSGILLCAINTFDSIKWKVGNEVDYRKDDSNVVNFGNQRVGNINITCIVYRKPNKTCYPNDDGIDTVTKLLYVAQFEEIPIIGRFKGKFQNDPANPDSFTINFRFVPGELDIVMDSMDHKIGWADYNVSTWYIGPRFYFFGAGMTALPKTTGYFPFGIYNKKNNTIYIKFRGYRSIEDPEKDRIWEGRRL